MEKVTRPFKGGEHTEAKTRRNWREVAWEGREKRISTTTKGRDSRPENPSKAD